MDFLGIMIVVIIYAFAIGSSAKRKKEKRARKQAASTRKPRFEQAFPEGEKPTAMPSAAPRQRHAQASRKSTLERKPMATQMQMELEAAGEGDDPCHEADLRPAWQSMRVGSVSQEGLSLAGEGEDPCHTGEAPRREENPVYDSPILSGGHEDAQALRRQVLSGVIMSEVLKRPQQRRMERKLRERA